MKIKDGKLGLLLRLGTMVGLLLFGQQAMAIGTAAGTQVDNTVSVDYDVNGVDQTDLTSSVSFVVDRRVDFTLVAQGAALVDVTPGETDSFFDFLLTNDSNSPLDFSVALTELLGGLVRGSTDDANMGAVDYAVSDNSVANGDTDPVRTTGPQFVDQLAADDSIRIRVFGDAALAMLSGQVAGVQLDATAREPGTAAATALAELANTDLGIENVFADAGNDAVETDFDGWLVVTADLAVTKIYNVIAGDLGSGLPIPGATVEYTVTVVNSSATAAEDVVIDDAIDSDVTLILNVADYAGNDVDVDNDGATLACDVEINGDGDGCDLVAADMTIGAADFLAGIDILGNTTLTIRYRVLIPDPDPTP